MCGFSIVFILNRIMKKNIKFNENKAESKMENHTHSFKEMNHVLQLLSELLIKRKAVIFCGSYFVRDFVKIFVFCLDV